jgi:hypothetical protein
MQEPPRIDTSYVAGIDLFECFPSPSGIFFSYNSATGELFLKKNNSATGKIPLCCGAHSGMVEVVGATD